jgi:cob(I)alamin adenosyltransferase
MNSNGLIHVYTGQGKGKTTVALGLTLRALGHGFNVYIIQFLKGGRHLGELSTVKNFDNLKIKQFGKKCPYSKQMKAGSIDCGNCRDCFLTRKQERERAVEGLKEAEKVIKSGKYDLVVLDEINNTVNKKLVKCEDVLDVLKVKHEKTEVVLTGRNAPKEFIEIADYVTVMEDVKHPFQKGFRVRRGIDY